MSYPIMRLVQQGQPGRPELCRIVPEQRVSIRTVGGLVRAYSTWARGHYLKCGRPTGTGEQAARAAAMLIRHVDPSTAVDRFGPLMLIEFQTALATDPQRTWSRKTINEYCRYVVSMYGWAVSREIVSPDVWTSLKAVQPLRKGRAASPGAIPPREPQRVVPVAPAAIMATRAAVSDIIRDMIDVQLLTAMRPTELCAIRLVDFVESGVDGVALYGVVDEANKVEHHDIRRCVMLGPRSLALLAPYMERAARLTPARSYLFRPCDAIKAALRARHLARVTPLNQGNGPGSRYTPHPKWRPGERYTTTSYRKAIRRGCIKAKVPIWSPNQLRHNGASSIANSTSIDLAREQLGHTSIVTTMGYVETDRSRLIEWAREHA